MNWDALPKCGVKGLKEANYLLDRGMELIGVEGIPGCVAESRMIFRGEDVRRHYQDAIIRQLPELSQEEYQRLHSMLVLLIWVERDKMAHPYVWAGR